MMLTEIQLKLQLLSSIKLLILQKRCSALNIYASDSAKLITLRGNTEEISEELKRELEARLEIAGVEVLETRLTHLAYATEIAHAMLQRQQAKAVLAARKEIVEGAVKMAKDSIHMLDEEGVLELDDERKANMVNNLLVAIVSDKGAQPVINTGSLY